MNKDDYELMCSYTYGKSCVYLEGEYTLDELEAIIKETRKRHEKYGKMLAKDMESALRGEV